MSNFDLLIDLEKKQKARAKVAHRINTGGRAQHQPQQPQRADKPTPNLPGPQPAAAPKEDRPRWLVLYSEKKEHIVTQKPEDLDGLLNLVVQFIRCARYREFGSRDKGFAQGAGQLPLTQYVTEEELQSLFGVKIHAPTTGGKKGAAPEPTLREQLMNRGDIIAEVIPTPNKRAEPRYHYRFNWVHDMESYSGLHGKLPCLVEGASNSKPDLNQIARKSAEIYSSTSSAFGSRKKKNMEAHIGAGVYFGDICGVYPDVEHHVKQGVKEGSISAYDYGSLLAGRVDITAEPEVAQKQKAGQASGAAEAPSGKAADEFVSPSELNSRRHEHVLKKINEYLEDITKSPPLLVLFARHQKNDPSQLLRGIVLSLDQIPKAVVEAWNKPVVEKAAIPDVMREVDSKPMFTKMRRIDMAQGGGQGNGAGKDKRYARFQKATLNVHMKEPDERGIAYDFGKPFSVDDADTRRMLAENHERVLARKRRRKGNANCPPSPPADPDDAPDAGDA